MQVIYRGPHPAVRIAATGQTATRGEPVDVEPDVAAQLIAQGWKPAPTRKER